MQLGNAGRIPGEFSEEVRYWKPRIVDGPGGKKVELVPFVLRKQDAAQSLL